ncbi:MAG: hypothetical protein FGF52_06175 [Candidatus Brockarchaeota archaeon]|nr:hypothetical protein [Candidatus Brockarchaeota archaeon]
MGSTDDPELETLNHIALFLAFYRHYEFDWLPLDKASRSRSMDDLKDALYVAFRKRDRIIEKLKEELVRRGLSETIAEEKAKKAILENIRKDAENLFKTQQDVSNIGKTIAILAASWDIDGYIDWLSKEQAKGGT